MLITEIKRSKNQENIKPGPILGIGGMGAFLG